MWLLGGRSGPGGRVLAEWVQEQGVEIHFGEGGTFERRKGGGVVQSSIDFVVSSPDSSWTSEDGDLLLSNHSSIEGSLVVGEIGGSKGGRSLAGTSSRRRWRTRTRGGTML